VNIRQLGHAIIHIDKYNEDYLIPLPEVKVQGLLTGTPYPELIGKYDIISSAGYVAEIHFSGKKVLGIGGERNHIQARVFDAKGTERTSPLYSVEGSWSDKFTIRNEVDGTDLETYDTNEHEPAPLLVAPIKDQDSWESRKAWAGVMYALDNGEMQVAANAKSKVEEGQREMRKQEEANRKSWEPIFFTKANEDPIFTKLVMLSGLSMADSNESGYWKFNREKAAQTKSPYHGDLVPANDTISPNGGENRNEPYAIGDLRPAAVDVAANVEAGIANTERAKPNSTKNGVITGERGIAGSISNPYSAKQLDPRVDAH
jgi:hypothetical protein